jgi:hypothetical protein
MVLYDKLWNTMKSKGISQYRLIKSLPSAKPVVCFSPYKGSFPALESKDSSKGSPAATSVTCQAS